MVVNFYVFMNIQDSNNIQMQLGKKGISQEFINDIKKNLAKDKLVKVKFLKNSLETSSRKELSSNVLENLSNLSLEHKVVGNVLFLKRIKN